MPRLVPVSQYISDKIGIAVYDLGDLVDADSPGVTLRIVQDDGAVVREPAGTLATRDSLGLYSYRLTSADTQSKGSYTVTWNYAVNGQFFTFVSTFYVTNQQPHWDSLDAEQRTIVEDVYFRVSDMFDSDYGSPSGEGGPYLWTLPQSNFGYETIAMLMQTVAVEYINFTGAPAFDPPFQIGSGVSSPFPSGWYGLLHEATYLALLEHLQTSYLEQPLAVGVPTARYDRRDYFDRYERLIDRRQDRFDKQLKIFKRKYMYGIRSRALLVAGGIFPVSYLDPARPRWPYVVARF